MRFSYHYLEGKFLPIVLLRLKGKEEWIESRAFVDTGASYSLFHADFATILGLELEHGELSEMVVGDGKILKVYIHRIRVSIAGQEFIASIGFSKDLGIGFYIIGRKDIFDRFLVSFNEKEKWVEFRPLL